MRKTSLFLLLTLLFAGCANEDARMASSASEALLQEGDPTRERAARGDLNARYLVILADYWEAGKYAEALPLLEELADEGLAGAAYHLANAYAGGQGGERDVAQAAAWLERAAELGSEAAKRDLRAYRARLSDADAQ